MQVVQAGDHKFLLLELDQELVANAVKQAGFEFRLDDLSRSLSLDLAVPDRKTPLLLFDAADPGNLGWFSRCQFYVDGRSGAVLQTPMALSNVKDRAGRVLPYAIRVQISKELPATFRLPGKQQMSEQTVYSVLFNFLNALLNTGVGVCGAVSIRPLAGRTDTPGRTDVKR